MKTRIPLTLGVALFLSACGTGSTGDAPEKAAANSKTSASSSSSGGTPSAEAIAEAKTIFANRCSPCHGPSGKGDGAASAGLNPKPRDFGDPEWKASVDDPYLEKIIQYGDAAVGRSPAMPPNPDLNGKPEVVAALRDLVRSFGE